MCELVGKTHNMNTQTSEPHPIKKPKRYAETFKRQAVEHWLRGGKSVRQTAAELGVNAQTLHQWKQQFQGLPAGPGAGTLAALQAENRRLQQELRRVSVQRDILKKTLGILSAPSGNVLPG